MNKHFIYVLIVLICGCSQPYSQYYHDKTSGQDLSKYIMEDNIQPELKIGTDVKSDNIKMFENGYALIGYSDFYGRKIDNSQAIEQGKKVKASIVIVYSTYKDTISGATPLILPDTKTSTTNVTASAFGSGGYATGYGSGTTTTYGTQTMYMPYTMDRFDQGATYWAKAKPFVFGVFVDELTSEQRQKIGSNKGLVITAVVKQSPAYLADILNGDILRKIDNTEVYDISSFESAIRRNDGKKVSVLLIRDGKEISKEVKLNPRPE